MGNSRLIFRGMNNEEDLRSIDPDSFRFHGPMKTLFYTALRLINPPPDEWLDRLGDPNAIVLRDIYREYLTHEGQGWRRDVLSRVIPFSICLIGGDRNYEEVANWFLYRICEEYERGRFEFDLTSLEPLNWWADQHRDVIRVSYRGSGTTRRVIERERL